MDKLRVLRLECRDRFPVGPEPLVDDLLVLRLDVVFLLHGQIEAPCVQLDDLGLRLEYVHFVFLEGAESLRKVLIIVRVEQMLHDSEDAAADQVVRVQKVAADSVLQPDLRAQQESLEVVILCKGVEQGGEVLKQELELVDQEPGVKSYYQARRTRK